MQTTQYMARRPRLNGLRVASIIYSEIRAGLNIPDSVLTAPVKELCDVKCLIDDYFQNQVDPVANDARFLHDLITGILKDISK